MITDFLNGDRFFSFPFLAVLVFLAVTLNNNLLEQSHHFRLYTRMSKHISLVHFLNSLRTNTQVDVHLVFWLKTEYMLSLNDDECLDPEILTSQQHITYSTKEGKLVDTNFFLGLYGSFCYILPTSRWVNSMSKRNICPLPPSASLSGSSIGQLTENIKRCLVLDISTLREHLFHYNKARRLRGDTTLA